MTFGSVREAAGSHDSAADPGNLPALAVGPIALIAAVKLLLHLFCLTQYGWFRDELYYVASTDHLGWGFVDHPPLSIAVLALVRAVFGDSLAAFRMVPILAGVGVVILTGLLARRLGGARFAQTLAALAALMAPVLLGQNRYYSMNALELLLWAAAALLLVRALDGRRRFDWAGLGFVLGLALLNKISALWLGGGIGLGLLLTPARRELARPGPWVAAGIAAVMFLPHVLWQAVSEWPTLEFMRNATRHKMASINLVGFLLEQLRILNVGAAPVWIAGLGFGLFGRAGNAGRVLSWIWLAVLAILLVSGSARASYLAPAYAGLFALGAIAVERFTAVRFRILRPITALLVVLLGLALVPMALPLLPVERFVRYQSLIGMAPRTEERHEMGALPQYYADMFGWEQMVGLVAVAYGRLTPEERARCRVFGQNYGEAGAVDVLGRKLGLPPAISGHNSYWMWGPRGTDIDVLIIIGGDREDNAQYFDEIEIVGQTESPWSMPYERGLDVSIGRKPRLRLDEAWPQLRHYN